MHLILTKDHQMSPFCTKLSLLLSPVCREYSRISNKYKRCLPFNSPNSRVLFLPSLISIKPYCTTLHLLPLHAFKESSLQTANQRTRTAKHLPHPHLPVHIFSCVCLRESVFYHLYLPTATIQRTRSTTIFSCTFSVLVSLQRSSNSTILNETASSSFTCMQRI